MIVDTPKGAQKRRRALSISSCRICLPCETGCGARTARSDPCLYYVTITVDQPSLSIVSTIANQDGALAPISISAGVPAE